MTKYELKVLCDLLEWAKDNRGSKDINPYAIPEVKEALKLVAEHQGIKSYLDARTDNAEYEKEYRIVYLSEQIMQNMKRGIVLFI